MRLEDQVRRAISDRVSGPPPPARLAVVRQRGRRLRRRRSAVLVATALVAALAAGGVGLALTDRPDAPAPAGTLQPIGRLDLSHGLRAFASPDPDGDISLGGRLFPRADLGQLDTDATATAYGVVYFDGSGRPHLLGRDGRSRTLASAVQHADRGFHPSSKADARRPLVAMTLPGEGRVSVVLHSFRTRRTVDTLQVPCSGASCQEVVVDGLDRGLVFVRTAQGTYVWNPGARGEAQLTLLGRGRFRVADVRNGHLLWADAPPAPVAGSPVAGWPMTKGAIDAQLSFDGGHVLNWSPRLRPTTPGGAVITLTGAPGAAFFTFDTDGSVLVATTASGLTSRVYDCELPSGTCTPIGRIRSASGDPMFMGDDI